MSPISSLALLTNRSSNASPLKDFFVIVKESCFVIQNKTAFQIVSSHSVGCERGESFRFPDCLCTDKSRSLLGRAAWSVES
ncbi:hypothetical protein QYF61_013336 [Mycteria americana]|uniref:Uncharacterized protein n=1 Tax=Mycteria americana TaxID=33587 RepID=A0AAN7MJT2_MYCAM|nr:hypothetical protein QYF61_013336 [Mycteria americana]